MEEKTKDLTVNETDEEKIVRFAAQTRFDAGDLNEMMRLLRTRCPWDSEQTHGSIRKNLLEEAYEACDAIDRADAGNLCEELGDVLLQVVFHARMSEEDNEFTLDDVTTGVCRKLVERHPHIFGDVRVSGSDEVLQNWDSIKAREKGQTELRQRLDDVPRALPALMRAQKLAKRAAKGGARSLSGLFDGMSREDAAAVLGARLFELCSAAEKLGLDAEETLCATNERFLKDF